MLPTLLLAVTPLYGGGKPVKVFILAGQSNMEGKAPNELFEHQATADGTKEHFSHLRKDGKWVERDDVFIKFLDRKGPLTLGFGSPGRTGAELEFGTMMGDRFEEPVVLVKAAWGGHSLYKLFRSPSAGFPDDMMEKELKQAQDHVTAENAKNNRNDPLPTMDDIRKGYGASYREMLAETKAVMENPGSHFPELAGMSAELAGLVWFQGWNDQYGAENQYASNMRHFINDVRRDLHAPKLPVVIAAMGQNGSKPADGAMRIVQDAQLSMNDVPEFKGTVKTIRTDVLVDTAAENLYPRWKEAGDEWKRVGGDHPYHYLGSAIWFTRIGHGMGEAITELLATPKALTPTAAEPKPAPPEPPTYLTATEGGRDYADQGEYLNDWGGAQVIALGGETFRLVSYKGGLPGAGWDTETRREIEGKREGEAVRFAGPDGYSAVLEDGTLTIRTAGGGPYTMKKTVRTSPTMGAKPPAGATVLFDGSSADEWSGGKLNDAGLLAAGCKTRKKFGDYSLHCEFILPFKPLGRGQARGNSGVYMQDRYEIQVLDSFGLAGEHNECGGIYNKAKPAVNMCLPPLAWQTYDIDFQAARFDADGQKNSNAVMTVKHNGVVIHEKLEIDSPTGGGKPETAEPGPIQLQGHGNPVFFRNIWIEEK